MFWKFVLENWLQCVSNIMQGDLAIKPVEVQHLLRLSFISKEATSLFEKITFPNSQFSIVAYKIPCA